MPHWTLLYQNFEVGTQPNDIAIRDFNDNCSFIIKEEKKQGIKSHSFWKEAVIVHQRMQQGENKVLLCF